jgi:hypothetical protein
MIIDVHGHVSAPDDRARLFEHTAAALFGLTGLQATHGPETV